MMVVALVMRAWTIRARELQCKPRILADDMEIHAQGENHARRFHQGYQMTLEYLEDMGAKVAIKKYFLFSTSTTTRIWLAQVVWDGILTNLDVVLDARDLGAHLNTSAQIKAPTMTKRLQEAGDMVIKIRRLPHGYEGKAHFIRSKALPKGLYGCEASHINKQAIDHLASNIVDTIAPHSTLRSPALVFSTSSGGNDLDPQVEVLVRRALATRRAQVYVPEYTIRFEALAKYYQDKKENQDKYGLGKIFFAGPVGLFIKSCYHYNLQVTPDRDLIQPIGPDAHLHELPVPLARVPYQHIRPLVQDMAIRQRTRWAQDSRTDIKGLMEIDTRVLRDALRSREPDDKRTLLWVANGSGLSESKLCSFGYTDTKACPHCSCAEQDFDHIIYHCPAFEEERRRGPDWIKELDFNQVPRYLRQGLPSAMSSSITATFWGTEANSDQLVRQLGHELHGIDS
jgi:hypothetical protein